MTGPATLWLEGVADEVLAMPSETWLKVPSFPGYIVSDRGRVRLHRVNAPILKGSLDKDGYKRVCLHGCTLRVHSIVAESFHGPRPEGFECAHLDGDKTNNAASNLAWVTHAENNDHKVLHGTHQTGEKHPRSKLTAEQVSAIRATEAPTRALAAEFGVNQSTISRIKNGDRWPSSTVSTASPLPSLSQEGDA